jgi:ribosome-binding factor A
LRGDADRFPSRSGGTSAVDRKTLQLCRQVERALAMALSGECDDDVLRELSVDAVEPMGSAAQLLVRIGVPASVGFTATDVMARLETHSARLRHLVARAVCRKRTPTLNFVLWPAEERPAGGGEHV